MPKRKIDLNRLRELWKTDMTVKDMAERMGVKPPAINRAARILGLPHRSSGAPSGPCREPARASVARDPAILEGDLDPLSRAILTHGTTYSGRARIAARHGLSETAVLQRFHRLRAAR